jgi:ubiquitin-conjugating enzyme E2 R
MCESESNFCLQNGDLCISILHPPVDDPQSGELPCERWNPTQNVRYFDVKVICDIDYETSIQILQLSIMNFVCFFVFRTILLSVISLLNEPNTFSPANVDASVMYRRWRDSKGKDKEYENIIRYVVHYVNNKMKTWFSQI